MGGSGIQVVRRMILNLCQSRIEPVSLNNED